MKALKIDRLCRRLGVTKGCFYWHFTDIAGYRAALVQAWGELRDDDRRHFGELAGLPPLERLSVMMSSLVSTRHWTLERAMREWARTDEDAAASVRAADQRERFLEIMLSPERPNNSILKSMVAPRACPQSRPQRPPSPRSSCPDWPSGRRTPSGCAGFRPTRSTTSTRRASRGVRGRRPLPRQPVADQTRRRPRGVRLRHQPRTRRGAHTGYEGVTDRNGVKGIP